MFVAVAYYLNGWSQVLARWQPLPFSSRWQSAYWPASAGALLASDEDRDLAHFLQQSYEKGESWLCFGPKVVLPSEVDLQAQRPKLVLGLVASLYGVLMLLVFGLLSQGAMQIVPATFMLAALVGWGGLALVTLRRHRRHVASDDEDFVADADLIIESGLAWPLRCIYCRSDDRSAIVHGSVGSLCVRSRAHAPWLGGR